MAKRTKNERMVFLNNLKRSVGAQRRDMRNDLAGVLADLAVLLHVAAGLTEKPDGRAVDGTAETGTDEAAAGRG